MIPPNTGSSRIYKRLQIVCSWALVLVNSYTRRCVYGVDVKLIRFETIGDWVIRVRIKNIFTIYIYVNVLMYFRWRMLQIVRKKEFQKSSTSVPTLLTVHCHENCVCCCCSRYYCQHLNSNESFPSSVELKTVISCSMLISIVSTECGAFRERKKHILAFILFVTKTGECYSVPYGSQKLIYVKSLFSVSNVAKNRNSTKK